MSRTHGKVRYQPKSKLSYPRFVLSFKRAKLPDETQFEIDGLAYDASGTQGISPTRLKAGIAMLAAGEEFVVLVPQGF
jgi:hypothetical protein